jgi:hypothetical protein
MNRVTGSGARLDDDEESWPRATLSNGVADALATAASPKIKKQAIERLVRSHGAQFKTLDAKTMDTLIAGAETELHEHSKAFKLDLEGSPFATGLSEFTVDAVVSASVGHISSVPPRAAWWPTSGRRSSGRGSARNRVDTGCTR